MTISRSNITKQVTTGGKSMKCGTKMKKMKAGGMCGSKKSYAKGGKVKGAGMCKKGVRPCKMM
jgi:hypothetical protein